MLRAVPDGGGAVWTRLHLQPQLALLGRAANSLEIADIGQGSILRLKEESLGRPMEQVQLLAKQPRAFRGQGLNQVLQHSPQAAGDLDALAAEMTDFSNC